VGTGKYDKYVIRNPLYEDLPNEAEGEEHGGFTPGATYMSSPQVAGAPIHLTWGMIYAVPQKNPYVVAHDHPYDEILLFTGFDAENPEDLGAVVELSLEDEVLVIDTTCGVYIPAGMVHCPLTVKSVTRPYGLAAICMSGRYETMDYASPLELSTT
jgi:hypothetical protein